MFSSKILYKTKFSGEQYGVCRVVVLVFLFALLPAAAMTGSMVWTFYPENTFELDPEQVDFGIKWNTDTTAGSKWLFARL